MMDEKKIKQMEQIVDGVEDAYVEAALRLWNSEKPHEKKSHFQYILVAAAVIAVIGAATFNIYHQQKGYDPLQVGGSVTEATADAPTSETEEMTEETGKEADQTVETEKETDETVPEDIDVTNNTDEETETESSDEETVEETNCDGNPVWRIDDQSYLDADTNGMLSGCSYVFEDWTRDDAEYRDGFWYKHYTFPKMFTWSVDLYAEPSLDAGIVRVPVGVFVFPEATDGNEWIYFNDPDGIYSGWMHLIKEPNVMYRVEAAKGMIQLDQIFNEEYDALPVKYGVFDGDAGALPNDSMEQAGIYMFKDEDALGAFIEACEKAEVDETFINTLKDFMESWKVMPNHEDAMLAFYNTEYTNVRYQWGTLWENTEEGVDQLILRNYYQEPEKTTNHTAYVICQLASNMSPLNRHVLRLIEYDGQGVLAASDVPSGWNTAEPVELTGLWLPEGTTLGEAFTDKGLGCSAGYFIESDRSEWVNPYPKTAALPEIYEADGWIEVHEPDDVLISGGGFPYIPTNHMETVEYEQISDHLWLTQVEVEPYTNTEIDMYHIWKKYQVVRYWCVVYSGDQVEFLFLRQEDFSEEEMREIMERSYGAAEE